MKKAIVPQARRQNLNLRYKETTLLPQQDHIYRRLNFCQARSLVLAGWGLRVALTHLAGFSIRRKLFGSTLATLLAAASSAGNTAETVVDCGGLSVSFDFNEYVAAEVQPSVPLQQQREFIDAFCAEVENVRGWFIRQQWLPDQNSSPLPPLGRNGSYLPRTQLRIFVANEYKISMSLVPAWSGLRGRMEFPAPEVIDGEAAIAHEIAHVYFPNGNRMLAEGLPIYLQHEIGRNPAFPDFKSDLHQMMRDMTCPRGFLPNGLDLISLVRFDRLATPDMLTLRIGRTVNANSAQLYPIAGSFVQFLIENLGAPETSGSRMEKFRKLYLLTPLVPFEREPGKPDRWEAVYGKPLSYLEAQ